MRRYVIGVEERRVLMVAAGSRGLAAQLAGGFRAVAVRVGQDLSHGGVEAAGSG